MDGAMYVQVEIWGAADVDTGTRRALALLLVRAQKGRVVRVITAQSR